MAKIVTVKNDFINSILERIFDMLLFIANSINDTQLNVLINNENMFQEQLHHPSEI